MEGEGGGAGADGGAGAGAGPPSAGRDRYFCYNCCIEFAEAAPGYKCPYCAGGFVERVEDARPPAPEPEAPQTVRQPPIGQISDIGIDDMDEPPPNNSSMPFGNNDLAFLMSGDRIRRLSGTMRLGSAESLLQQLMWQVTGGRVGGPPLLVVGHNQSDYVMSNEGLDAVLSQLLWNSNNDGPPPLAADIIESLPEVSINEDQVASKLQCSVCWEVYDLDEKVRQLKCGHLYHKICISPWLSLHATCPICRQSLSPPITVDPEQQRDSGTRDPNATPGAPLRYMGMDITSYLLNAIDVPTPQVVLPNSEGEPEAVPSSSEAMDTGPGNSNLNNAEAPETPTPNESSAESSTPTSAPTASNQGTPNNAIPNSRHRIAASITPNHIVLMSSAPQGSLDNNMTEYIAFWSGGAPISSSAVSSTTSHVNTRPSTRDFDMELD